MISPAYFFSRGSAGPFRVRVISHYCLVLGFIVTAACVSTAVKAAGSTATGQVNHVVIAWLKKPGDPAARAKFIRVTKSFADLPGVVRHSVGEVLPGSREVVDSSFDVAAVITFESHKALQAYLHHPRHKQAVHGMLKPLVRKIIVYDIDLR